MGLSDAEIRRELTNNNIGGTRGIMRGEFEPFKVTTKNFKEMREAGIFDQFPRAEIQEIRRQMNRLPLAPDDAPRTMAPSRAPVINDPFNTAPVTVPSAPVINDPFKQGSLPQPTFPVTAARAPGPVNPALLGDDPFSAAANAQIANRLG